MIVAEQRNMIRDMKKIFEDFEDFEDFDTLPYHRQCTLVLLMRNGLKFGLKIYELNKLEKT